LTAASVDVQVRAFDDGDRAEVLELLVASLRWVPDELFERFFEWKHDENPFGRSPAWVAVADGRIVGFRTFMRWEFEDGHGRVHRAVRAVDTATHPDAQGKGVFRTLTTTSLDHLRADGVDFVFNTPNAQSRPGYLRMGWHDLGPLSLRFRASRPAAFVRMLRARVPADRWSLPSDAGDDAPSVLADDRVTALVAALPTPARLRTRRTVEFLRWRYGFAPLRYRAITVSSDPAEGVTIFRVRRRGPLSEIAVCDALVPAGRSDVARALDRRLAKLAAGDYAIRLDRPATRTNGFVLVPRQGPRLAWRGVNSTPDAPPSRDEFDFRLGDIELF
jgi:GNAT superfamily N-acetyltransferase